MTWGPRPPRRRRPADAAELLLRSPAVLEQTAKLVLPGELRVQQVEGAPQVLEPQLLPLDLRLPSDGHVRGAWRRVRLLQREARALADRLGERLVGRVAKLPAPAFDRRSCSIRAAWRSTSRVGVAGRSKSSSLGGLLMAPRACGRATPRRSAAACCWGAANRGGRSRRRSRVGSDSAWPFCLSPHTLNRFPSEAPQRDGNDQT